MANWRAFIAADAEVLSDRLEATVVLTDGTQKITRTLVVRDSNADVSALVSQMARVAPDSGAIEGLKIMAASLKAGREIAVVIPAPPDPPDPPSKEKQAWLKLVSQLILLYMLSPTHPVRAELQQQVDDAFKPEFL